jgi:hypothetical protein
LENAVELMLLYCARPDQISLDPLILCDYERRVWLVFQVIPGQKIGKQFAIFENRVDRVPQETGFAADRS